MSDFKAKMHNSISAGAPQQTPLGELTALQSLDLIAVFKGPTSKGRNRGEGRKPMGMGGEKGKKEKGRRGVGEGRRGEGICWTNVKLLPIRACDRLHGNTYSYACVPVGTVIFDTTLS